MGDHEKRLEEILAEWDLDEVTASVTAPASLSLDLSNTFSNVSLTSPYTVTTGPSAAGSGGFTMGTTYTSPWFTQSNLTAPKIKLDGKGADVEVNGWSLVAAVKRIEERLGLFQPNPELEAEWADLQELGEQYRKLEQHIKDKQATWDRLKSMPAPEVD